MCVFINVRLSVCLHYTVVASALIKLFATIYYLQYAIVYLHYLRLSYQFFWIKCYVSSHQYATACLRSIYSHVSGESAHSDSESQLNPNKIPKLNTKWKRVRAHGKPACRGPCKPTGEQWGNRHSGPNAATQKCSKYDQRHNKSSQEEAYRKLNVAHQH